MTRSNEILLAPAHTFTGRDVIEKVCKLLEADRGYRMTLERLSLITGRKTSTEGYSFGVGMQRGVLAFISMVERLSRPGRERLFAELFRVMPTVLHDRLAHDPRAVSDLLEILAKPNGLTVVTGPTAAARSWVLTAMGNTFPQIDPRHRAVGGLDAHSPLKLVPCENVFYLRNGIDRERSRQVILEMWPKIRDSAAPVLLFHDVWSLAPETHAEIMRFAAEKHVIISNPVPFDQCQALRKKGVPVHVVTVSVSQEQPDFINVSCHFPQIRRKKTTGK